MTRTLKAVAAAAATLCLCATASAQSSVSIYGLLDLSVGQFQNAGATKDKRVDSGNMTTSFMGFSGTEDLGGGLKANFALEHFISVDTGSAGRFGGDKFWARSAWVGLSGDFGSAKIGRTTNQFFVSTLLFNSFADSFGFSPAIRQILIPGGAMPSFYGDTGWSNSITYSSPKLGPVSFNLQATSKESDNGIGGNVGGNVLFFSGPFSATIAAQKVKGQGAAPVLVSQESVLIGAAYDLQVVKFFAQYATHDTDLVAGVDSDTKIYQIGASAPIGPGSLLVQYGNSKAEYTGGAEVTNKTLALGYVYGLSKRTNVYGVYLNDKLTGVNTGNTFALGIRHSF